MRIQLNVEKLQCHQCSSIHMLCSVPELPEYFRVPDVASAKTSDFFDMADAIAASTSRLQKKISEFDVVKLRSYWATFDVDTTFTINITDNVEDRCASVVISEWCPDIKFDHSEKDVLTDTLPPEPGSYEACLEANAALVRAMQSYKHIYACFAKGDAVNSDGLNVLAVLTKNLIKVNTALRTLHGILQGEAPKLIEAQVHAAELQLGVRQMLKSYRATVGTPPVVDPILKAIGVNIDYQRILKAWLKTTLNRDPTFTLKYQGSKNGAAGLYASCYAQSNILIIAREAENGYLFGGFTQNHRNTQQQWVHDTQAFVFTLRNADRIPPTRYFTATPSQAICRLNTNDYIFGNNDLVIPADYSRSPCTSAFPAIYTDTTGKGKLTFTGKDSWTIDEVLAFQV